MTEQEIFERLKEILVESFMIEEADIKPEANLFVDLDFDSIDAIDLAAKLHSETGHQLNPEQFKDIRTVADLIKVVAQITADKQ